MSERFESRRGFVAQGALVAVTVGGLAAAAVIGGPKIYQAYENWHLSKIVTGAPAQVSSRYTGDECSGWHCVDSKTTYFLGLEQCPQDVRNAKNGRLTESFSPSPSDINPGCVFDNVQVAEQTYTAYSNGSTITFAGPAGGSIDQRNIQVPVA